jgi:hypothetical protein
VVRSLSLLERDRVRSTKYCDTAILRTTYTEYKLVQVQYFEELRGTCSTGTLFTLLLESTPGREYSNNSVVVYL